MSTPRGFPPPMTAPHTFHQLHATAVDMWIRSHARRIRIQVYDPRREGREAALRNFEGTIAVRAIEKWCESAELLGYVGPLEAISLGLFEHDFILRLTWQAPDPRSPQTAVIAEVMETLIPYHQIVNDASQKDQADRLSECLLVMVGRLHEHITKKTLRVDGRLALKQADSQADTVP
jgi:hypothetical protein